jgi:Ca-activated chloride channel family protein
LKVESGEEGIRVSLQEGEVIPDRDCVLAWRPPQEANRPALRVALHDPGDAESVYFLALVAPPAAPEAAERVPREVILLVDHSGSMEGPKWEAADWAVKRFLADLAPADRFALGLFHNTTRWFPPEGVLHAAEPERLMAAIRFLEEHRDSGSTELGLALEQALALPREPGAEDQRARHVLIVTDAQVTDAARLLALADAEAQRVDARRVSLICIDAAPNSLLATELAERGGGVARFLTSSPEEEDITTALDELLADWAAPVLADLRLEVDRPGLEASGRRLLPPPQPGWSALEIGDMPAGRTVWAAGRIPRGGSGEIAFRLNRGDRKEIAARRPRPERPLPGPKALFGARRLLGLEYLLSEAPPRPLLGRAARETSLAPAALQEIRARLARLGYDPHAILPDPPSGVERGEGTWTRERVRETLRELLVRESLDYGLVTSETAFVATRTEAGKPVEGTAVIANALPVGWSEEFIGMLSAAPAADAGSVTAMGGTPVVFRKMRVDAMAGPPPAGAASPAPMQLSAAGATPTSGFRRLWVEQASHQERPVFVGVPQFVGGEALLFDSARPDDAARLPENVTLSRLEVGFPEGAPPAEQVTGPLAVDAGLSLLLYVEELAEPRARIRLADLLRQGGARPLNIRRAGNSVVRLVLVDPNGAWAAGRLSVAIGWR